VDVLGIAGIGVGVLGAVLGSAGIGMVVGAPVAPGVVAAGEPDGEDGIEAGTAWIVIGAVGVEIAAALPPRPLSPC
jgi:hypothetical protein